MLLVISDTIVQQVVLKDTQNGVPLLVVEEELPQHLVHHQVSQLTFSMMHKSISLLVLVSQLFHVLEELKENHTIRIINSGITTVGFNYSSYSRQHQPTNSRWCN